MEREQVRIKEELCFLKSKIRFLERVALVYSFIFGCMITVIIKILTSQ